MPHLSATAENSLQSPNLSSIILMRIVRIYEKPTMSLPNTPQPSHQTAPLAEATAPVKRIKSQELFMQMRELEIDHEGRIYHLRMTQHNKLILTA